MLHFYEFLGFKNLFFFHLFKYGENYKILIFIIFIQNKIWYRIFSEQDIFYSLPENLLKLVDIG